MISQNISNISNNLQLQNNLSFNNDKLLNSNNNSKMEETMKKVDIEELNKTEQIIKKNKVELENSSFKYEVPIVTTDFGFNTKTKDFYIKVSRNGIENKFPTDEMMKLKEYLMNQNQAQLKENN